MRLPTQARYQRMMPVSPMPKGLTIPKFAAGTAARIAKNARTVTVIVMTVARTALAIARSATAVKSPANTKAALVADMVRGADAEVAVAVSESSPEKLINRSRSRVTGGRARVYCRRLEPYYMEDLSIRSPVMKGI